MRETGPSSARRHGAEFGPGERGGVGALSCLSGGGPIATSIVGPGQPTSERPVRPRCAGSQTGRLRNTVFLALLGDSLNDYERHPFHREVTRERVAEDVPPNLAQLEVATTLGSGSVWRSGCDRFGQDPRPRWCATARAPRSRCRRRFRQVERPETRSFVWRCLR